MKIKKHFKLTAIALALVCANGAQAAETDRDKVELMHETTLSLIQLLVEQGVIKQEAADEMLKKAEQTAAGKVAAARAEEQAKPADAATPEKGVVRVTYVPEHVKREIRDQVRQEVIAQAKQERWGDVNAVPEWLDRLKWEGDFRLRYQGEYLPSGNPPVGNHPVAAFETIGQKISNTSEDNNLERMRLRLGLNANVTSGVDVGLRLTTGSTSNPVSTNQTLGNYDNKYSIVLDRAFAKLTPLDDITVWGGRMPNPFFSTDLVWDEDLNFDGVAVSYAPGTQQPQRKFKPFITAGAFPLQTIEQEGLTKAKDKWLYALQGGVEWVPSTRARFKLGLGYYDYRNILGVENPTSDNGNYDLTAPDFRQKGNTLFSIDDDKNNDLTLGPPSDRVYALAAEYRIANVTLVADFAEFFPIHIIGSFDWARNLGFNEQEVRARATQYKDFSLGADGYQAKLTIGYPKITERHEWQAFAGYRYIESDAVLDAFTDSDFHLGGTNAKGFMVGGSYGLYKNTWLSARWLSSDAISGLFFGVDVFQLDLNAKF